MGLDRGILDFSGAAGHSVWQVDQAARSVLNSLLDLTDGEETVIWANRRAYVVTPATEDDIERIGCGYYCMD